MRTIPVAVAATLLADRPDLRAALRPHGRAVGHRVEVDVDAVSATDVTLGHALWDYHRNCQSLWRSVRAGRPAGKFVAVRRVLVDHVQRNTKTAKVDLVDQLAALSDLEGLAQLVLELTEPAPDVAVLGALVGSFGGTVTAEDGIVTATVPLEGTYAFPEALGGLTGFGEVRRHLTITTRQAAWRDRRVRRLARVLVETETVLADPSASARALAAPQGAPVAA